MTPHQIALVRASFARIAPQTAVVGKAFYATLFNLNPEMRGLFPPQIENQARKLMEMLGAIVAGLDEPERLHAQFRDLGLRHQAYGATEDHYDDVGAALLQSLHAALGADFTTELETAWATVYADLAEHMIAAGR